MANTYTWNIVQLDAYPEKEGLTDVVFTVHWTLVGKDKSGNTGSVYGAAVIPLAAGSTFTPIKDLTKEQVIQWVIDSLGEEAVANHKASIDKQIKDIVTPPVVNYSGSTLWPS